MKRDKGLPPIAYTLVRDRGDTHVVTLWTYVMNPKLHIDTIALEEKNSSVRT